MIPSLRRAELRLSYADALHGELHAVSCGGLDVQIYLHRAGDAPAPLLFEMHGGGFALGDAAKTDKIRSRVNEAGIHVVGINYRKAPEHPYPAALEDVCGVIEWFGRHGRELGVRSEGVFIMGESGGANLAAAAALRLGRKLRGQILHYPVLDMARPYEEREHFPTDFAPEISAAFNEMYLPEGRFAEPMVSPLYAGAELLAGAPDALIIAAGQDMLRSDAAQYAGKLKHAGVPALFMEFEGAHHGYIEDWFNPECYGALTDREASEYHLDSFGKYAEKAIDLSIDFIRIKSK